MLESVNQSESRVYEALFGLTEQLAAHDDLDSLCMALAESLRTVVECDVLGVMLHDADRGELRLHASNMVAPRICETLVVPVADSAPGWVWQEQQPLVLPDIDQERRWPMIQQKLVDISVHSAVLLPLTHGERRLGVLGFLGQKGQQASELELAFMLRVASECAVTVDAYLMRQALVVERNRLRTLFDITNALASKRTLDELFPAISRELSRVMAHDLAAIALLDRASGQLRLYAKHLPTTVWVDFDETSGPVAGLPAEEALRTGQPVVVDHPDYVRFPSPLYRRMIEIGAHFGCTLPLLTPRGALGTLELARLAGGQFSADEVRLGMQVAGQIAVALENSLAFQELVELKDKLATEKLYLEDEIRVDQNLSEMVGESPAFATLMKTVQIVAPTEATVLILGETGTGKELIARSIHEASPRRSGNFVKVNCAAIPATLLESELFGHEKGSFTGAIAQKMGRFELADHGTLFLDEIGEIPLELQSKLLRAIQEQEFERVGGTRTLKVDLRLIAATNRDLKAMMEAGKFRDDLYYRLHVFPLQVPPLRERKPDIPLLVSHFTRKFALRMNRKIDQIPSSVMAALANYSWPGNIRELQNLVERSVILTQGPVLRVVLPEAEPAALAVVSTRKPEREAIIQALDAAHGRVGGRQGAAARLGLKRTTLQSRMRKLGIERRFG
jgi:formate hydrogenlyase transcriptional activator